jgi:hypothetical protein
MFARALMQIAGMSVDNVLALTEVYPTPSKYVNSNENIMIDYQQQQLFLIFIRFRQTPRSLSTMFERERTSTHVGIDQENDQQSVGVF